MRLNARGALIPERGFSRRRAPRSELLSGGSVWVSADGLTVITSIQDNPLPGSGGQVGPTWLVSVTRQDSRPSDQDMTRVVEAFDMPAWDEDNHFPGVSRGLFCPVDPAWRNECECKLTETVHVEPDGYAWTNDSTGPCRGCQLEAMHLALRKWSPCPIHRAETSEPSL